MKSNGRSTEPWGTPYCTWDRYDTSSFTATNWWRSDKYDLNPSNALPLMPMKVFNSIQRMLWSIVSNAALRSRSTNREIQPRSDDKSRSFVTLMRAVSVLWDGLNPEGWLSEGWLLLRSYEGVGFISSLVFSHLRSLKGWIQTEACVIPSYHRMKVPWQKQRNKYSISVVPSKQKLFVYIYAVFGCNAVIKLLIHWKK